jgi:hypothetical protein
LLAAWTSWSDGWEKSSNGWGARDNVYLSAVLHCLGLPVIAALASLTVSLFEVSGTGGGLSDVRADMRETRSDIKLLTGKVYEMHESAALNAMRMDRSEAAGRDEPSPQAAGGRERPERAAAPAR